MGAAAKGGGAGAGLGLLAGMIATGLTGGAAAPLMLGAIGVGASAGAATGGAIDAKKAADRNTSETSAAIEDQRKQSDQLKSTLLQTPKQVSPDNYLAMKSKELNRLRLGLASTITGASNSPAPTLSSPTLTASGTGKNTLGA